ncbi:MAG TPA: hypothetical protein VE604_17075 [Candidatus Polarisedimenticolia bacterium]|jgi:hypothetical protein|nr:hypothetical protein [Candidatus Polarisedimenticolia bacterium]
MSTITATSNISTPNTLSQAEAVPWLVWANVIASISIATGLYWDISWHETIGRDSFWTPAHLLIQFGAVLGAFGSAWVIMRTTFGGDTHALIKDDRRNSVNVLGFRAPLGAFIAAWGGGAMLTSAPFDNWWHEAYGLDVKIISPPHMLLALGIAGIMWGGAILAASYLNRATGEPRIKLQRIVMLLGGFIVVQTMTLKLEYTNRVLLHSGISYMVMGIGTLLLLEGLARVAGHRWARTIMTGIYSAFVLILMWVLPFFPAQPKLGPVYQDITHMVPLPFPLLLIVPAFFLDLLLPIFKDAPKWQQAVFGGVAFLAILIVVQWPFATFLMSPLARNRFFSTTDFPYFALPTSPTVRHVFVHWEQTPLEFWRNMGLGFMFSVASMWAGIYWGGWLKKVRR